LKECSATLSGSPKDWWKRGERTQKNWIYIVASVADNIVEKVGEPLACPELCEGWAPERWEGTLRPLAGDFAALNKPLPYQINKRSTFFD